jgi:pimeloyl-ACP methyl ester carboxylesterase
MKGRSHPETPPTWLALLEAPRTLAELTGLLWSVPWLNRVPRGDGHPVIVVPGFGANDWVMWPLRSYLQNLGYDARPWGLGFNYRTERITKIDDVTEFRAKMQSKLLGRIRDVVEETGSKVSVVGWSLGGIYANALACKHPALIRRVITLGAPFGDPRGTKVWKLLKELHRSDVPEEVQDFDGWLRMADAERRVPTTVIYSPSDGIVPEAVACLTESRYVENVPVHSSHTGFAFNPLVYRVIAEKLAVPE